jgi:hypothetical protein
MPSPPPPASGYLPSSPADVASASSTVEVSGAGGLGEIKQPKKDDMPKATGAKLSPELLAIYRCAVSQGVSTATKGCKAAPAQIKVTVDLAQTKPGLEHRLTSAGLKIISGSGSKQLVGMAAPAQLKQLAQIAEVKSISLNK